MKTMLGRLVRAVSPYPDPTVSRRRRIAGPVVALVLAAALVASSAGAQTFLLLHAFQAPSSGSRAGLVADAAGNLYGTTPDGGTSGYGTVFKLDGSGGLTTLHSFDYSDGFNPSTSLILDAAGNLYGTTASGGSNGYGTVFKLDSSGGLTTLHGFSYSDGAGPQGPLIFDASGNLYGTTHGGGYGGDTGLGTVFKLDASGNLTTLHKFDLSDGGYPTASLVFDGSGNLYGTTSVGSLGYGTVFKLDGAGNLTTLHSFTNLPPEGANPVSSLIFDATGNLYGTTAWGGSSGCGGSGCGTIFKIDGAGHFTTLHSFDGSDGASPWAAVILDGSGNLFGTTSGNSLSGPGTVFRLDGSGTLTTLHSFDGTGGQPYGDLIRDASGNLYGTTYTGTPPFLGSGTVFKLDSAGNLTTLHSFNSPNGANPYASLILDASGNSYGTTSEGGSIGFGYGTIFKLDGSGNLTTLHSFDGTDGNGPYASLILDGSGNLYGTTVGGGGSSGHGTIFKLDSSGNLTTLHSFNGSDGSGPLASLLLDASGNLYGTTRYGGSQGLGTVFKLDSSGNLTTLHSFVHNPIHPQGAYPRGSLILDASGTLYGTTSAVDYGTPNRCGANGDGTIFKLDASGSLTTLHRFDGSDGACPYGALVLDASGNLYGTTSVGGAGGYGTVFKLDSAGHLTTLHGFNGSDGAIPLGSLILDASGNLYGTTSDILTTSFGTVFKLDASGNLTTLHSFNGPDGVYPYGSLVLDASSNLYGTAGRGGMGGGGVVFSLSTTSEPQSLSGVLPTSGPASGLTPIDILGTGLLGTDTVTVGGGVASGVSLVDSHDLIALTPAMSPGTLNDVVVSDPGSATLPAAFFADFLDVPHLDIFHDYVEKIFRHGITNGYGNGYFGRDDAVTRAQMAVFLLKAEHGPAYTPPTCVGVFADVPCTPGVGYPDWIEELASEHITGGCYTDPLRYCPDRGVRRDEMAVFLLKTEHGSSYTPPPCAGIFADVPCTPTVGFSDWIEQLSAQGVTAGCYTDPLRYCPDRINSRGEMAVFLAKTFSLP